MKRVEAKSKIDSVTIYSDRVMVTRIAELKLKESVEVAFLDLPGALEEQSVRIKAKDLKIGEVMVKPGYIRVPHPRVKELETRIKKLEVEDRALSDETVVQQEKEKFLNSISVNQRDILSKEIMSAKISPDSWREGLRFISEELIQTKKRIFEIEQARKELKKKLDALRAELNDVRSYIQNRKSIIFDVHPDKEKKYTIELRYILYGASWETYYELRAKPSQSTIELSYFSKISQRTGEDWNDVELNLSTAKPAYGGAAPEPYPWYIDFYQPVPQRVAKTEALREAAAEPEVYDEELVGAPETVAVESGVSIIYRLPGRHTLKSGEPERKLKIIDASFDAEFQYLIIPRQSELAYLTGKFKNNTDYLFLAGSGGTYVGDDFTGNICLPLIAPSQEETLSFGIDERVEVKRELKKSKVSKGGLVKKNTKYEFLYENKIKNFHKKEIKCKIIDFVPVPQNPEIKVEEIKFEPRPTKDKEKELGIYHWETSISPDKEYTIKVSFVVEAPLRGEVEGLM
ncbi:MAG: mucoidy inhibitor MuiA family protein [Candidatus Helarchaeota archaeon]